MFLCATYFLLFSLVPAIYGIAMNSGHFISHLGGFCSAYCVTSAGNFISKRSKIQLHAGAIIPHYYNGFIYFVTTGSFNHITATSACSDYGCYLVVPQSDGENTFISSLTNEGMFLGINDTGDPFNFIRDVDGRPIQYTKWGPGNPDNKGGVEPCVSMSQTGVPFKEWNDTPCSFIVPKAVCLYPSPEECPNTEVGGVAGEKCCMANN